MKDTCMVNSSPEIMGQKATVDHLGKRTLKKELANLKRAGAGHLNLVGWQLNYNGTQRGETSHLRKHLSKIKNKREIISNLKTITHLCVQYSTCMCVCLRCVTVVLKNFEFFLN